jgi:intracellular multiplication protein IcmD
MYSKCKKIVNKLAYITIYGPILFITDARSATVADIAKNVSGTFGAIAKLITAGAYVGGMVFFVVAILKFKQHKDNPSQIPIGTPIALLFVAAALIFLPTIFGTAGETIFGQGAKTAGIEGTETF